VIGCVRPVEELADRSDVVVVARIERVEPLELAPCPELQLGKKYVDTYRRCGSILAFTVTVTDRLRGDVPASIVVRVPRQMLELPCDDRPAPEAMTGAYAFLFLEASGEHLWLVDGPDSIHGSRSPFSASAIDEMREELKKTPRRQAAADGP
jgi:hypothetical protein